MRQINYKPDLKILSIRFKNAKSADSEVIDNVVLDFDDSGHIVNIDVMDVNIEEIACIKKGSGLKIKTA